MKYIICLGLAALFGVCRADFEACEFDESTFSTKRMGPRSEAVDDAEAYAECQKNENLADCQCLPFEGRDDDCDGSLFQSTAEGMRCVAKNGAKGKGVQAVANCQRSVITCETSYQNMPSTSCPDNYKLMFCTLHSSYMHQYPAQPIKPRVKRDGGICKTTNGCEDCRVQARCIRITGF